MDPCVSRSERLGYVGLVLLLLFAADTAFVVIHLVHSFSTHYLTAALYSIECDGGFAEWFQYVQEFWVVILTVVLWKRMRAPVYLVWSLLFTYLLLDDAFRIHETCGHLLFKHLHLVGAFGLQAQDYGELIVSGVAGLGFLLLIGFGYASTTTNTKHASRDITFILFALVFFGVGVDMVHSMLEPWGVVANVVMGVVEDGGEMFVMSVLCWYLLDLLERGDAALAQPLWNRVGSMARQASLSSVRRVD